MSTLGTVLVVLIGGFLALMVGMQILIQSRARALAGKPVPPIPGPIGARVSKSGRSLLYFFSPMCGACRAITPRVKDLSQKNRSVFAVDVSDAGSVDVARALQILATPSTVEIADGKIQAVYIGPIPQEVLARFS
ncbi:MAG: thioredoxin family protein [Polyangiaceae bacterium]